MIIIIRAIGFQCFRGTSQQSVPAADTVGFIITPISGRKWTLRFKEPAQGHAACKQLSMGLNLTSVGVQGLTLPCSCFWPLLNTHENKSS